MPPLELGVVLFLGPPGPLVELQATSETLITKINTPRRRDITNHLSFHLHLTKRRLPVHEISKRQTIAYEAPKKRFLSAAIRASYSRSSCVLGM